MTSAGRRSSSRSGSHVRETGATILEQLKAIGCSADWSRTYFTLDEDLSRAVREVFVRLYDKGLIYRGHYIINWCPRCLTALSNEEAEKEETDGQALVPPLPAGRRLRGASPSPRPGPRRCWATRPWPCTRTTSGTGRSSAARSGSRWSDRLIPVVADDVVDPAFGTGAVKVTPGPRPHRLRDRRSATTSPHGRHDAGCAAQDRGAGAVPRAGPVRGAASGWWRTSRPPASWRRSRSTTATPWATATGATRWSSPGSRSSGS